MEKKIIQPLWTGLVGGAVLLVLTACSGGSQTNSSQSASTPSTAASSVEQVSSQETASSSAASSQSSEASGTEKDNEKEAAMDIAALAQGDYSSVKGTWQDASGNQLVFDDKGLVSDSYEFYGASLTDYGTASGGVYGGETGGFLLEFIPKGITVAAKANFKDDSDAARDRIWTGVGLNTFDEQGTFYYRLD
ncbi:DUF6287 domain-containing protein [Streptococcus panodentis]|uniref:DUF6287 domain-containing protein n=1 Tax=Streptococcus panodentis TaxID=1581472 RepID=A0ABS5B2Q8_9STRE|nr:DUF6287 domain-containing protein [Streptococcus panodentis]MBP2622249.1 hypothetical protein [Streptococcus panodentis]